MAVLTKEQLYGGYFHTIGGFPPAKIVHTLDEFDGSDHCCIACTQLQDFSEKESKRILNDWIQFLRENPTTFKALHFNSRVPQKLFDAACCQQNLTELRLKWGSYADLSSLTNLKNLQYLYLGSCPGVQDLTPITEMENLIVLYVENFKHITDYSSLKKLNNLEQLVISGPTLGKSAEVQDVTFLLDMPNLASVWFPNVRILKHYSDDELELFRTANIQGVYNQEWWNR